MNILILGYSRLVKKRILNVILKNNIRFSIASKSSTRKVKKAYSWYRNYRIALNTSNADLVYVSLPNSQHYYWAKKALEKGYHVIVDKPLSENFLQAKNLIKIAKNKKKLIAEATFFNYHNQFNKAVKLLNGVKNIKHVNANFVIPFPKKNSILMSKKLSGGCLMDMGPYAAGVARLFCSGKLIKMYKTITKNKQGLIVSFSILCQFEKTSYSGYFCFGGEYQSNLTLFSKNKYIELNRVFSPPYNKNIKILIKQKDSLHKKKIKKDNVFENFLKKIKYSLNQKKYNFYYKTILEDIKFREKILR